MKYPSPQDVDEMRSRGYDRSVIEEAIELSKRWHEKERIKNKITIAFLGVQLGNGVGLHQAQGLDDRRSEEVCARYRDSDEKYNWASIEPDLLNKYNSSLSFFDPEGLRFHLPAFLIADLDGEFDHGMEFCLTMSHPLADRFSLLDPDQRDAVRVFLLYILDEPDYSWNREHISHALSGYWSTQDM